MNNFDEMPDGITLNGAKKNFIELELSFDTVEILQCSKCIVEFEGVLVTNFGRHEGNIIIKPSGTLAWKNLLSKKRDKAESMLKENLKLKLDKHMEMNHND